MPSRHRGRKHTTRIISLAGGCGDGDNWGRSGYVVEGIGRERATSGSRRRKEHIKSFQCGSHVEHQRGRLRPAALVEPFAQACDQMDGTTGFPATHPEVVNAPLVPLGQTGDVLAEIPPTINPLVLSMTVVVEAKPGMPIAVLNML